MSYSAKMKSSSSLYYWPGSVPCRNTVMIYVCCTRIDFCNRELHHVGFADAEPSANLAAVRGTVLLRAVFNHWTHSTIMNETMQHICGLQTNWLIKKSRLRLCIGLWMLCVQSVMTKRCGDCRWRIYWQAIAEMIYYTCLGCLSHSECGIDSVSGAPMFPLEVI